MDENGGQMGVVPIREAMDIARSRGYDLIEIAPTASPPVCKLMDYGKFKYEQGRRDREAHKKQKTTEVKGIRLRPGTDEHDLDVKKKHLIDFLKQGNKVKTTVIFRSREMSHPEFARRSLEYLAEQVADIAVLEKPPSFEGRTMTMILTPRPPETPAKGEKKPAPASAQEPPAAEAEKVAPEVEVVAQTPVAEAGVEAATASRKKKEFVLDPNQI